MARASELCALAYIGVEGDGVEKAEKVDLYDVEDAHWHASFLARLSLCARPSTAPFRSRSGRGFLSVRLRPLH